VNVKSTSNAKKHLSNCHAEVLMMMDGGDGIRSNAAAHATSIVATYVLRMNLEKKKQQAGFGAFALAPASEAVWSGKDAAHLYDLLKVVIYGLSFNSCGTPFDRHAATARGIDIARLHPSKLERRRWHMSRSCEEHFRPIERC
jgi:hypothetical protein